MATLEKIRNKSVLLFVIIIVALLAFILGDFLTSGRTYFGSTTTVAKAGGITVEYQDYQNRISQLSEQLRAEGRDMSSDAIASQALNALVAEGLMNKEYERLGIVVTDNEIKEAMFGEAQHPLAARMISSVSGALRLSEPDAHAVYDAISNPARYGRTPEDASQIAQMWAEAEKEIETQLLGAKFGRLMNGLFTSNKLDAQSVYNDVATTRHIAYAVKDASTVSNDDVEFSDADVEALWNSQINRYAVDEERRQIDYIYVRIEPSQADREAARILVEDALMNLNTTEGLDAVSSDARFVLENGTAALSQINDHSLSQFLDSAAIGQAVALSRSSDQYVLAKLIDTHMGIDSINVSFARMAEDVDPDSIAAAINAGSSVASLMADGNVQGVDSVWNSLEVPGMDDKFRDALTNAAIGNAFVYTDSVNGTPVSSVLKVNMRHAPVKFYDFATITFTVDPSQETLDKLSADLRTYVSNNSSAAEFSDNASESGYPVLSDEIGASSVRIGNAEDSRRFIKWTMEAREGQVSPVFQDDRQTYLLAIAVKDIFDDYRPYTSPRLYTQLQTEALDAKKASKLMEQYAGQGTDLESYAQAMGVEISEGDVNITSPILLNLGINESALSGAIAATGEGQFAGPVQGKHGILVFEVRSIDTANRPYNEDEYGQLFLRNYNPLRNPVQLLLGKNKVDNRTLNFIANPAE